MECLHRSPGDGEKKIRVAKYDREKIAKIREKISIVFGRPSTWDDVAISERYNITPDGDLIMIVK
ncbi:hypothetical protein [uncultured Methanoregula sp.]|uniref:hypothetical protein n=1 Tax=uncultured Methanoregula sp. TaxID=1005933 RepID=UPI002AABDA21|nr:hypothetical protein [uncultured Methanoregula sp.]